MTNCLRRQLVTRRLAGRVVAPAITAVTEVTKSGCRVRATTTLWQRAASRTPLCRAQGGNRTAAEADSGGAAGTRGCLASGELVTVRVRRCEFGLPLLMGSVNAPAFRLLALAQRIQKSVRLSQWCPTIVPDNAYRDARHDRRMRPTAVVRVNDGRCVCRILALTVWLSPGSRRYVKPYHR